MRKQLLLFLAALTLPLCAADHYVSAGSAGGDGTYDDPWTLSAGLNNANVADGDTVYLRGCVPFTGTSGCTYTGEFVSDLTGTSGAGRITVRNYPGEVAYLVSPTCTGTDETLEVTGDYTIYQSVWPGYIDISNSCTTRTFGAGVFRTNGVEIEPGADNNVFQELFVHDAGMGIVDAGANNQVLDPLLYNNGKANGSGDFTNGHGLYPSSSIGSVYRGGIIVNNYGVGIHAYGTAGSGRSFDKNIVANNGRLTPTFGPYSQFLWEDTNGSSGTLDSITNNIFWLPYNTVGNGTVGSITFELNCYTGGSQGSFVVNGNYIHGGGGSNGPAAAVAACGSTGTGGLEFTDNTAVTANPFWSIVTAAVYSLFDMNTYRGASNVFAAGGTPVNFAAWQGIGWEASSTYSATLPTTNFIAVTASADNPNRANITVLNYEDGSSATVDISGVASVGSKVQIFNAQNFPAGAVWEGIYAGGSVVLPLNGASADPVGDTALATDQAFGAFILYRQDPAFRKQAIQ